MDIRRLCLDPKVIIILLVLATTALRLIPVLSNNYCSSDDCPAYLNYITGKTPAGDIKEPMFRYITKPLYAIGLHEVTIMRLLTIFLPIIFSYGLYLLGKDRLKDRTLIILIAAANLIVTINVFWFVMVRNGMMLAVVPFFLHYMYKDDFWKTILCLLIMGYTHASFILFITPVILWMIDKKDQRAVSLIAISFILYSSYASYPNLQLASLGFTKLSYIQMDIMFLFIAVYASYKKIGTKFLRSYFTIFGIITILFFLGSIESYRIFYLLNIPVLLMAMSALDKPKFWNQLKYAVYIYLVMLTIFYMIYVVNIQSVVAEDIATYHYLGSLTDRYHVVMRSGDYHWTLYFTGKHAIPFDQYHPLPSNFDYIFLDGQILNSKEFLENNSDTGYDNSY